MRICGNFSAANQSQKDLKRPLERADKFKIKKSPEKQPKISQDTDNSNKEPKYCAFTTLKEQSGLLVLSQKAIQ